MPPQKVHLLLINYYWPPSGGSAVQRWLHILAYLSQKEIECYVITIKNPYGYYAIDESMSDHVATSIKLYRTKGDRYTRFFKRWLNKERPITEVLSQSYEQNPSVMNQLFRWVRGNFFIPDQKIDWIKYAYRQAQEIIEKYPVQLIVTAGPPHSTHLTGLRLKKRYPTIKWIVDFHDFWTDHYDAPRFMKMPFIKRKEKRMEASVVLRSDGLLTPTEIAKEHYLSKYEQLKALSVCPVTMGYNSSIFCGQEEQVAQFIVLFVGRMTALFNPFPFFESFLLFAQKYSKENIVFRYVGYAPPSFKHFFTSSSMPKSVDFVGLLPHEDIPYELARASILFMSHLDVANEELFVPGKVFEYIAGCKPIICLSSKNSGSAYYINRTNAGRCFERHEVDEMCAYLEQQFLRWKKKGSTYISTKKEDINFYSAENQAKLFALFMRKLVDT